MKKDNFEFVRFNWGYHDGADDARKERGNKWENETHFSARYKAGYLRGYSDLSAGCYTGDSTKSREAAEEAGEIKKMKH